MLALKAPYGIDASCYVKIKITRHGEMPTYEAIEDLLDLFGTHRPAIPKIYNCLRYSGQYECHLEQGWFARLPNIVRWCFSIMGMNVTVEDIKGCNNEELLEDFAAPVKPKKMRDFIRSTYNRRGEYTALVQLIKERYKAAMLEGEKAL